MYSNFKWRPKTLVLTKIIFIVQFFFICLNALSAQYLEATFVFVDYDTGQPIKDASLFVQEQGYREIKTDSRGTVVFDSLSGGRLYSFVAEAPEYLTIYISVYLEQLKSRIITIKLLNFKKSQKRYATFISGRVINERSEFIPGVSITINVEKFTYIEKTDLNGEFGVEDSGNWRGHGNIVFNAYYDTIQKREDIDITGHRIYREIVMPGAIMPTKKEKDLPSKNIVVNVDTFPISKDRELLDKSLKTALNKVNQIGYAIKSGNLSDASALVDNLEVELEKIYNQIPQTLIGEALGIMKRNNNLILPLKIDMSLKKGELLNAAIAARNLENNWVELYPDLPNPFSCMIALAQSLHNGNCEAAYKFEECFKLTYDSIKLNLALGMENVVLEELQKLDQHFGAILQVALENQNPCSKFAELAYNYALMTKGLILERGDIERNLLNNSTNLILKESITKIKTFRRDDPVSDWSVLYTEMLSFNKALEHEIEKLDIAYPDLKHKLIRNYQWKDVLNQLHENEASVEYLLMPSKNGNAKDTNLLAVVLNKNNGVPIMVKLGRYNELKAIFFKNFETNKSLKPGSSIFRGREASSDPVNRETVVEIPPDLSLYNLILAPLFNYLHGVNKVYYAPVDILNFIPFAAIPTPSGKYLGEFKTLEFRQVYSTRKVAQLFQENLARGHLNIHAFGNIDYGKRDESRWDSLPQTKLEVDFIGAFCKETKYHDAWLYEAKDASEESFNAVCNQKKQSILHLATHGFYHPDKNSKSMGSGDPLERAGLIFANANEYQPAKNGSHAANDGWLFASEISNKDLAQVHLAVLSACESGLGDIVQNEGVFGLPRAFLKAGAQTLLVSLWPVDDLEAKKFMVEFYKNYLPGEMSAYQALHKARATYWNSQKFRAEVKNWAGWVLLE